jgi:cytochrome c oxidase subunit 2
MERFLGLTSTASAHGPDIDYVIGVVHWLMLLLFTGWGTFFVYTLVRFRASKNKKANYAGVKSHASSYHEVTISFIEGVLLFAFAFPLWAMRVNEFPDEHQSTVVKVIGEQYAWNIHYPGPDGVFGRTDINLVDTAVNPLGIDRTDLFADDDVITLNQLHLPVDKPVIIYVSSKDVIHSFSLNAMRVKQDAIPGMEIPTWFIPVKTGEFQIGCAQLCGLGHYRMVGFLTIHTQDEYQEWMDEQQRLLEEQGDEDVW